MITPMLPTHPLASVSIQHVLFHTETSVTCRLWDDMLKHANMRQYRLWHAFPALKEGDPPFAITQISIWGFPKIGDPNIIP